MLTRPSPPGVPTTWCGHRCLSIWWVQSMPDPDFSGKDQHWAVQAEGLNRSPARRSSPDDTNLSATPTEVIGPWLLPGIVESHQPTASRIASLRTGVLEVVAPEATPAQVVEGRIASE